MRSWTEFLAAHAKAIYIFFIFVAMAGYLAFEALPRDVYPELSFPRIAVIAEAGDTSPDRILVTVTRVLEDACAQVFNVRWVRSKTIRGSTELSVDFDYGTDMVFALHQLQSRIAEVVSRLPQGLHLTIELVTPAIFPIASYNVSTEALTQRDLYLISRYQIQPSLTRVPGVSRVQIQGGDVPQLAIQVSPEKLKSYNLSVSQVADALSKNNQLQVVGRTLDAHQESLIVAAQDALEPVDIGNFVVTVRGNNPIYVHDLATVENGFADRLSRVSVGQRAGVVINIFRQPKSNVLAVTSGVKAELAKLKEILPLGVSIQPAYDESQLVSDSLASVRDAILLGILFITVVLFAFLRSWKTTIIAALAIPLSALAAFGLLYLFQQSLNLMSLGGLAVAIGLVIDDAIVVIENIKRQSITASDSKEAVRLALSELIGPVTSSTATTCVVFLPLGLLQGVTGQFFTSLTVTLASAIIFSWLISLSLTPVLAIHLLKRSAQANELQDKPSRFAQIYAQFLKRAIKMPALILSGAFFFIAVSWAIYGHIGTDFLPQVDEGSYVLDYLAQQGTALSDVDKLAEQLEKIVGQTPEVKTWTRRTGAELGLFATETNKGDILVVLKPKEQRSRSVNEIMDEQRGRIEKSLPQVEVDFHQILQDQLNDLSGAPRPIEVKIFGPDPALLRSYAEKVSELIKDIPGIVDVTRTSKLGAPQIEVNVDPLRAGRLGLSPQAVAQQLQDSLLGRVAMQIQREDRLEDVRVRLNDSIRFNPETLNSLSIAGTNGSVLPLSAIATIHRAVREREIFSENQARYVSVEAELKDRDLGSAVADINKRLVSFKLDHGYRFVMGGLYSSQQESFHQLSLVLLLAVMLVYLLLVIQFRSLLQPLIIFLSLPLALVGVEAAILITHTPLNVSSFMGVILLVGLVVKNGIILLEYTNRLLETGIDSDDAIVKAATVRLRPIMMTTICTLLGLLPLAIGVGSGAELQKPLAIAVIGGLSVSTLCTLIYIPTIRRMFVSRNKSIST